MAKELPYFKFEPNQWENGGIQMCSKEIKGLFIDICSVYWSKLGELPYALALQKHCNGDATGLQTLIDFEIIGNIEGQIIIEFLDEQLNEFQETSKKRREAANKRWNNASALQMQSKSNAIREEKIREDKQQKGVDDKKTKIIQIYDQFVKEILDGAHTMSIDAIYMKLKIKKGTLGKVLEDFKGQLIIDDKLHTSTQKMLTHFNNYCNTQDRLGKLDEYKNQKRAGSL